jgi:predicted nucleotidyltransferase
MNTESKKTEAVFEFFNREIQKIFGDEVVSVTLFGSAATEEYVPKKSDINFLVVLTENGIEQIDQVQKVFIRWQKKRISLPLFITKSYIDNSLDSFPVEFLNMKLAYRVISGEDVLGNLKINKEDLRLQCEHELKGKLLQLRQGFIQTGGNLKAMKSLVSRSIIAFTSIFKALLFLRDKEIPKIKHEVIIETCKEFKEIDEELFSRLLKIKESTIKSTKIQIGNDVHTYILQIRNLSKAINNMVF